MPRKPWGFTHPALAGLLRSLESRHGRTEESGVFTPDIRGDVPATLSWMSAELVYKFGEDDANDTKWKLFLAEIEKRAAEVSFYDEAGYGMSTLTLGAFDDNLGP